MYRIAVKPPSIAQFRMAVNGRADQWERLYVPKFFFFHLLLPSFFPSLLYTMLASTALIAALVKSKAFPTNNVHSNKPVELSREAIQSVANELKQQQRAEDAASSAGSQTTIVDEDVSIHLLSKIKKAMDLLFTPSDNEDDKVCLLDAHHAIEYIAYGLSDLIFVYPGSVGGYLGQDLKNWQSTIRNCRGDLVKVVEMETRAGALQAVHGALHGNNKVASILTTSQALLSMIPNIHAFALARKPVVIHVAAYSVDQDLVAHSQIDAVLAARNTGALLLASNNVQEAHDMAVVAQVLAQTLGLPVIHYYDGASTEIQKASLTPYNRLATLKAKTPAAGGDPFSLAQEILAAFGYNVFDYAGAGDAETVLVALGAGTSSVADAVARSASDDRQSIGLVSVRLYRPWSESSFVASLPKTTKRIIVLEQGDGLFAFNGPLFLDVAAAVRFGPLVLGARPKLVTAQAETFNSLDAGHIPLLLKDSEQSTFVDLTKDTYTQPAEQKQPKQDVWSAIFWDVEQDGTADAGLHASHLLLQQDAERDISASIHRDAYRLGGAAVNTRIVTHSAYVVPAKADYIAIHNIALIKEYNILAQANKKAKVLVHGPWKHGDEIEGHLTNEFKLALTQLDIQLYSLDGARIAEEFALNRKSSHVVWEAAFWLLTQHSEGADKSLTKLYHELEDDKPELPLLLKDIVEAVRKGLKPIELLPTWTILEINDQSLPTQPVSRVVRTEEQEEADDRSDSTAVGGEDEGDKAEVAKWHKAAWQLMFKDAYETETALRPDLHESTYLIKLTVNKRLTPVTYDRNVFHLEFDTTGSNLKYELGDALGVHGHNDYEDVKAFLDWYGLNGDDVVLAQNGDKKEARTVFQWFAQVLDIFGRPSKKFYESLASYATDPKEKEQLLYLISSEGKEEYKKRVDDTITYEDLLREFTSAKPPVEALVRMITPIKPRHYSIASSQKMHPNSVHLLVVAVDWVTSSGKKRYGQCTRYLANLPVGSEVTVSIKPSVMKLPPLDTQPVIMAGLGTGMAPFRAFIQERAMAKAAGKKVGPMVLYFGSRNRRMEYLYGEELEAYHADGLLTHMGLAFSRDQKQKVYIQHKMMEDAEMLHDLLVTKNGHFYLCGPTWPVPDVKDAVVYGLKNYGGMDERTASNLIEEWKEKEKYILEVY